MLAAYIDQTGDLDEIKFGEIADPIINEQEVLVEITAVSVNFVDTFVRSGGFQTKLNFPFVLGRDGVGVVKEIGQKVTDFQVGDLVWTNSMGYDGRAGTASQLVAIPSQRLFKIPNQVDPIKLVAAVHSAATAAILLTDILKVEAKKNILIEGGAGHVGIKLVELAKNLNLQVATTSNTKDFDKFSSFGAVKAYDYHQPISQISQKFDYIVDTSGKVDLQMNLNQLKLGGQIALITAPSDNQFSFDVRQMYTQDQAIKGFVISHAPLSQIRKAAKLLNQAFAQGKLLDDKIVQLPMAQMKQAQSMLLNHQTDGQKIVLTWR